jgi:hypothetical protein
MPAAGLRPKFGPVPAKSMMDCVPELPIAAGESAQPRALLCFMLTCFATGDLRRAPEVISPLYYDHQSADQPVPHGPDLFCSVVQEARDSLPHLDIEIVAVRAIGSDMAQSHARCHWTDESGQRRVTATADLINTNEGGHAIGVRGQGPDRVRVSVVGVLFAGRGQGSGVLFSGEPLAGRLA